jgi:AcrR family transcriptional regulator
MSEVTNPTSTAAQRRLRSDARRNRERILEAARETFSAHGVEAQMDEIARRAGVGVGTVYRHFPTKEALLGELVAQKFRRFTDNARAALEVEDPWDGFAGMLRANAELVARDAALQNALMRAGAIWQYAGEERRTLEDLGARIVQRAQDAGVLRRDFSIDDIPMLMCGVSSTMQGGHFDWRRHLDLVLDGLRVRS